MSDSRRIPSLPAALCAALVLGCADSRSNVMLVTFDTTRYDHLGCTGDPEARTPTIDSLADRGTLFENAFSSVALTLPAHTTILTGIEPPAHGVLSNGKFRVPERLDTLAEILKANGYATAAFVSAFVLDARFNLSQGFDVYGSQSRRRSDPLDAIVPQRSGAEVTDEALRWLQSAKTPFFLWVHYYDPHLPRKIEAPFDAMPDPYRAEIAYADSQMSRLLKGVDARGQTSDTLVLFTADHGESLGEHGEQTHGIVAYDSTLHVPLIVAGPSVPKGVRRREFARHIDLLPTILGSIGIEPPDDLPGRDLMVASHHGEIAAESVVGFFESRGPAIDLGWAPILGVRNSRWKFTAAPEPVELYDIESDPDETQNLAADRPDVVAGLREQFAQMAEAWNLEAHHLRTETLSIEVQQQLAALGYVEAPAAFTAGEEPDPRRYVAVHGWVDNARRLAGEGQFEQAIQQLETLVESPTIRPLVLRSLAPIYEQSGRYERAIAAYRRYIDLTAASEARIGLARTLLRAGRPDEALSEIGRLPETSSHAQLLRAVALARANRHSEARAVVDAAFGGEGRLRARAHLVLHAAPLADGEAELRGLLAQSPEMPVLKSRLGYYLALWGDGQSADEALALLREAASADPVDREIQSNLGWGAYRLGRTHEAVRVLSRLVDEDGDALQRFRLAHALAAAGDEEQALAMIRAAITRQPAAEWLDEARRLERRLSRSERGSAEDDSS